MIGFFALQGRRREGRLRLPAFMGGRWTGSRDRSELPKERLGGKAALASDATEARPGHAIARLLCVPSQPKPAGVPALNSSALST